MSNLPPLQGIHHVSAVTGRAAYNVQFYTGVLGLRLVCKTVNQDDPTSYHLFYADETGAPGTDLTFFDVPQARQQDSGTRLISGTSLRVRGEEALRAWAERLDAHDVPRSPIHHRAGRAALTLQDAEGQTFHLVDDHADADRVPETTPWTGGPVGPDLAVQGLGPVEITVGDLEPTRRVLEDVLGFTEARSYEVSTHGTDTADGEASLSVAQPGGEAIVFEVGPGGVAAELHVIARPDGERGWLGKGGVHHLALRTPNEDTIAAWRERIDGAGLDVTPVIDRHYFRSIYFREPGGILIEIATDTGAPFPVEEAAAGRLTLPPALEPQRDAIEAQLPEIETAEA
jgi:glyoxalase family protein